MLPLSLPRHLGAALGALLIVARLPGDVRLAMSTVGADAVPARSGGEGTAHPSRAATASPSAALTPSAASTSSTHTLTSLNRYPG